MMLTEKILLYLQLSSNILYPNLQRPKNLMGKCLLYSYHNYHNQNTNIIYFTKFYQKLSIKIYSTKYILSLIVYLNILNLNDKNTSIFNEGIYF